MGSCLSLLTITKVHISDQETSTIKVISIKGDLHEYNLPVTVSQALRSEESSSSSASLLYFLCNSDSLNYDDVIPELNNDDQLCANQIYFVLPMVKRNKRLSASDMAALAVRASNALKHTFVSPVMFSNQINIDNTIIDRDYGIRLIEKTKIDGGKTNSSASSAKKLRKSASKQAKVAAKSFKQKLSTIYEGSVH